MALPGKNKSKFSFTSFISKANNIFGVAVSYASPSYNSFSNAISGIYNFNYKNFFLNKFNGSSEMSQNIAHNVVINILKIIPPLNGYFSYMSKAKAEQEVDIKLPDPKINDSILLEENIRKSSAQIGFSININTENTDSEKSPKEGNLGFEWIIVSEENADQLQYQNMYKQKSNDIPLQHKVPSPFEGWGASNDLGGVPKLNSIPSRVVVNSPVNNLFTATTNQYIFPTNVSPDLGGQLSQCQESPDHSQDTSLPKS